MDLHIAALATVFSRHMTAWLKMPFLDISAIHGQMSCWQNCIPIPKASYMHDSPGLLNKCLDSCQHWTVKQWRDICVRLQHGPSLAIALTTWAGHGKLPMLHALPSFVFLIWAGQKSLGSSVCSGRIFGKEWSTECCFWWACISRAFSTGYWFCFYVSHVSHLSHSHLYWKTVETLLSLLRIWGKSQGRQQKPGHLSGVMSSLLMTNSPKRPLPIFHRKFKIGMRLSFQNFKQRIRIRTPCQSGFLSVTCLNQCCYTFASNLFYSRSYHQYHQTQTQAQIQWSLSTHCHAHTLFL